MASPIDATAENTRALPPETLAPHAGQESAHPSGGAR